MLEQKKQKLTAVLLPVDIQRLRLSSTTRPAGGGLYIEKRRTWPMYTIQSSCYIHSMDAWDRYSG